MIEEKYSVVTEAELLSKVSDTENNFIERKTVRDHQGWLETAVAFANSCPVGQAGILYVGVDNEGRVRKQPDEFDFDKLQKSISAKIANAWPPIYFVSHILTHFRMEFIEVVIFGSPERPHFSGPAYVRVGPETRDATEDQYDSFVGQRSSKVRALHELIGQTIHWQSWSAFLATYSGNGNGILADCNQFFVTIRGDGYTRCFPVDRVMINFDPNNNRYMLMIPMD
jgi:hypothetical protein